MAAFSIYEWKIFYEGPTVCCKITTWNNNLLHCYVVQPNSKSKLLFSFSLSIPNFSDQWKGESYRGSSFISNCISSEIQSTFASKRNTAGSQMGKVQSNPNKAYQLFEGEGFQKYMLSWFCKYITIAKSTAYLIKCPCSHFCLKIMDSFTFSFFFGIRKDSYICPLFSCAVSKSPTMMSGGDVVIDNVLGKKFKKKTKKIHKEIRKSSGRRVKKSNIIIWWRAWWLTMY